MESSSFPEKRWNLRIDQIMPIVPATLGLVAAYVAIPQNRIISKDLTNLRKSLNKVNESVILELMV